MQPAPPTLCYSPGEGSGHPLVGARTRSRRSTRSAGALLCPAGAQLGGVPLSGHDVGQVVRACPAGWAYNTSNLISSHVTSSSIQELVV